MNRFYKGAIWLLTISIFTLVSVSAFANFRVPPKPENGWYVMDLANKLTQTQINNLNDKIDVVNKNSRNEVGVLIVPTLGGETIDDAAYNVFNTWKIGKIGLDNGILLMISSGDHKYRIEVGRGAEGDIPDMVANQIARNDLVPHLKTGDYYGGINAVIDSMASRMESRVGQKAIGDNQDALHKVQQSSSNEDNIDAMKAFGILVGFLALLGLTGWWLTRHERKSYNNFSRTFNQGYTGGYTRKEKQYDTTTSSRPYTVEPVSQSPPRGIYSSSAHSSQPFRKPVVPVVSPHPRTTISSDDTARRERQRREDAARKRRDDDDSSSSYSSYTPTISSSNDDSSGGGFGGGSSGGGGASGDW